MKFIEVMIWLMILALVLTSSVWVLSLARAKYVRYINSLKEDSMKINLYNYSNYLSDTVDTRQNWYIYFTWNNFFTWTQWVYQYHCDIMTGDLINIDQSFSWVFCSIEFDNNEIIYSHKLF